MAKPDTTLPDPTPDWLADMIAEIEQLRQTIRDYEASVPEDRFFNCPCLAAYLQREEFKVWRRKRT